MSYTLKRWLAADVEQSFAKYAGLEHAGAPQGQAE
jgi:hypothetical protein